MSQRSVVEEEEDVFEEEGRSVLCLVKEDISGEGRRFVYFLGQLS